MADRGAVADREDFEIWRSGPSQTAPDVRLYFGLDENRARLNLALCYRDKAEGYPNAPIEFYVMRVTRTRIPSPDGYNDAATMAERGRGDAEGGHVSLLSAAVSAATATRTTGPRKTSRATPTALLRPTRRAGHDRGTPVPASPVPGSHPAFAAHPLARMVAPMSDGFKFGDSRARDDLGGCCGKPVGCWLDKRGCVHKVEKAEWQEAVENEEGA